MNARDVRAKVRELARPEVAEGQRWYFKTAPGEYGAGDEFLGLKVPLSREIAKEFRDLSLTEVEKLLKSRIHEERLIALLIVIAKFSKASQKPGAERKRMFDFVFKRRRFINNWDLVDTAAPSIFGPYLYDRLMEARSGRIAVRALLVKMARSRSLWERRIAMLTTFYFIRQRRFDETFAIAEILLLDEHDLIHKAVGWMLREVGNLDATAERAFLKTHAVRMPRTMLRYAIEKFPEAERRRYLKRKWKEEDGGRGRN